MSMFSMQNENSKEAQFFDILIKKHVYYGFIYSLISIPIAIIYFIITLLGLVLGFILLPFWIGVPILNQYFGMIWELSKLEEKIFEYTTGVMLPKITKFVPNENSAYLRYRAYLHNKRTWNRIAYFLLKIFWRILFAIPSFTLITLTSLLIYTPVNSVFGRINIYQLYQTDSFIEVIMIFFVCILIWVAILHFINYLIKVSTRILNHFFCR